MRMTASAAPSAAKDAYIPASRAAILEALSALPGWDGETAARLPDLARVIAAVMHYEAYADMERLRALYAPLDPDARSEAPAGAFAAFEEALTGALLRANFTEIDAAAIDARGAAKLTTDLRIRASDAGIRRIRFFVRGAHSQRLTQRRLLGLRTREIEADILSDVIVVVAFKPQSEIARRDRRAFEDMRRGIRPGAALVKHFRHVARAELITLHPGAKPTMRPRDQVFLAVPALAGGIPVALQIAPAVTVLFAVIAAYLGMRGAIEESQLKQALAAISGLVAVGAFVMRQWMKYERQTLKYQKQLSDTVYFRNVANNAGVLDALIGAGEEQDAKEAILAYALLRRAENGLTKPELDRAIEAFLREAMRLDVDFEIGDALAKLERLGLVTAEGETLRAAPIAEALARLDAAWDSYFQFGRLTA